MDRLSLQRYIDARGATWEVLQAARERLRREVLNEIRGGYREALVRAQAPDLSWRRTWGHE